MKRLLFLLVFIITFILLLYKVGSTVVDFIMSLMPMSAKEWFPLIEFLIWVFTFSFDLVVTIMIVYITIAVASLFVKK
jgi:hypothetical protein